MTSPLLQQTAIQLLSETPLFTGIDSETLKLFSSLLVKKELKRNELMISQGDTSRSMFFIITGRLKVFYNDEDGTQTTFAFIGSGDYCGELSLLDAEPRSASVIALEKTVVLQLSYQRFDAFLEKHPQICYPIFKSLTRSIREIDQTICSLSSLDVYGRLIQLLYKEVEDENGKMITQRLTHQDIAEMVGSSREMISRILSDLRKGGYIDVTNKRISIERKLPRHW